MPWLRHLVYGVSSVQRLAFIPGHHILDLRWTEWHFEVVALSRSIFLIIPLMLHTHSFINQCCCVTLEADSVVTQYT